MERSWKARLASFASGAAAVCICLFALVSILRVGMVAVNLGVLFLGLTQVVLSRVWVIVAYRIAAIEMVLLALLSLQFYFAAQDGATEFPLPFGWRLVIFAVGVVVFVGAAGICLEEAAARRRGSRQIRER